MEFHYVEENLRESFRALARGRANAGVEELRGVSIASLGVAFQMFNAAFLSEPVDTPEEMAGRLDEARAFFLQRRLPWAFWICEDWLTAGVRRRLSRLCEVAGLRLTTEMPGMMAERLKPVHRDLPELEVRRVEAGRALEDFRAIGATCFHVPIQWFSEVFDESLKDREFTCWVGYSQGNAVATAASVISGRTAGIYNIATSPTARHRGYGEAITRYAARQAVSRADCSRVVLQSTSLGYRLYQHLGFEPVTRILVYNSSR